MKKILLFCLLLAGCASYATASPLIKTTPGQVAIEGNFEAVNVNYTAIVNWHTAVADVHDTTGVDSGLEVTVNGADITNIDISAGYFHVQGPQRLFAGVTSLDPGFGAGENSMFIGMTMSGYTSQEEVEI